MMRRFPSVSAVALITAVTPIAAHAHTFGAVGAGWSQGFAHPLLGIDHVLAMAAVGLWAAQLGGRSLWLVPAAFIAMMAVGGMVGMAGFGLPWTEGGIAASVLALGVLVAAGFRLPLAAGMALVGVFAIFHGHAHGTEMPEAAAPLGYAAGFVLATALLHVLGMGAGQLALRAAAPWAVRMAGAATAMAGTAFLIGAF